MTTAVSVDVAGLTFATRVGNLVVEHLRISATRIVALGDVHGDAYGVALQLGAIADHIDAATERSRTSLDRALEHAASRPFGIAVPAFPLGRKLEGLLGEAFGRLAEAFERSPDPTLLALFRSQRRDDVEMILGLQRAALRGAEFSLLRIARAMGFNVPSHEFTPTGHRVMFVSGLGSSSSSASDFDTAARALGYRAEQRMHFSYAPGTTGYTRTATFGDIEVAVRAFDVQMRKAKQSDPSSAIDIIGHSEGGFVALYWLQRYYDPMNPAYPRVANVVTLGAPLRGAPAADLDAVGNRCPVVEAGIRAPFGPHLPPDRAQAVEQMASTAPAVRSLAERPMPDGVHIDAITAPFDYVVPANRAALPGRTPRMVSPQSWNQHHALLDDPASLRAMQRALNRQPEPPQAATEEFLQVLAPYAIATAETQTAIGLRATVCR